jgi:hypothetical protein
MTSSARPRCPTKNMVTITLLTGLLGLTQITLLRVVTMLMIAPRCGDRRKYLALVWGLSRDLDLAHEWNYHTVLGTQSLHFEHRKCRSVTSSEFCHDSTALHWKTRVLRHFTLLLNSRVRVYSNFLFKGTRVVTYPVLSSQNSTEHNPSLEILRVSLNSKIHCRIRNSPLLLCILNLVGTTHCCSVSWTWWAQSTSSHPSPNYFSSHLIWRWNPSVFLMFAYLLHVPPIFSCFIWSP